MSEVEIVIIPYSPLARGFLTSMYSSDDTSSPGQQQISNRIQIYMKGQVTMEILGAIVGTASKSKCSPSQVSLARLLSRETVASPSMGPRESEQLVDNLGVLTIVLSGDEIDRLDVVSL